MDKKIEGILKDIEGPPVVLKDEDFDLNKPSRNQSSSLEDSFAKYKNLYGQEEPVSNEKTEQKKGLLTRVKNLLGKAVDRPKRALQERADMKTFELLNAEFLENKQKWLKIREDLKNNIQEFKKADKEFNLLDKNDPNYKSKKDERSQLYYELSSKYDLARESLSNFIGSYRNVVEFKISKIDEHYQQKIDESVENVVTMHDSVTFLKAKLKQERVIEIMEAQGLLCEAFNCIRNYKSKLIIESANRTLKDFKKAVENGLADSRDVVAHAKEIKEKAESDLSLLEFEEKNLIAQFAKTKVEEFDKMIPPHVFFAKKEEIENAFKDSKLATSFNVDLSVPETPESSEQEDEKIFDRVKIMADEVRDNFQNSNEEIKTFRQTQRENDNQKVAETPNVQVDANQTKKSNTKTVDKDKFSEVFAETVKKYYEYYEQGKGRAGRENQKDEINEQRRNVYKMKKLLKTYTSQLKDDGKNQESLASMIENPISNIDLEELISNENVTNRLFQVLATGVYVNENQEKQRLSRNSRLALSSVLMKVSEAKMNREHTLVDENGKKLESLTINESEVGE